MGSFEVRDEGGVLFARARAGVVTLRFAEAFCRQVEEKAEPHGGQASLVMDLSALSKATPRAALYALRRMKAIPLARIAIVGGNGFMRSLGRFVLTVGRFPSFAFFATEGEARSWLARR